LPNRPGTLSRDHFTFLRDWDGSFYDPVYSDGLESAESVDALFQSAFAGHHPYRSPRLGDDDHFWCFLPVATRHHREKAVERRSGICFVVLIVGWCYPIGIRFLESENGMGDDYGR